VATVQAGLFRKVKGVAQQRERIHLKDGDFLDLDWSYCAQPTSKAVLVFHGLEGDAQRPYVTGCAKQYLLNNFDVCAVNLRGCSGTPNDLYKAYHSGATDDVHEVITHLENLKKYSTLVLHGFSLGANLVLKYLGEKNISNSSIKSGIAISVPCDLHDSLEQLLQLKNYLYTQRFKKHLVQKLRMKQKMFPEKITLNEIKSINTLKDFDDVYTSKAHGFKNALDYYEQSSSLQFLHRIKVPTLIINAKNDSFLGPKCYPIEQAKKSEHLYLEMPLHGGHVGFQEKNNISYPEKRVINFLKEVL
jgi:predicted alpha/beta-fold hydrolase